jgi:hypothetical protein
MWFGSWNCPSLMTVVAATKTCWNAVGMYDDFLNSYMCIPLDQLLDNIYRVAI